MLRAKSLLGNGLAPDWDECEADLDRWVGRLRETWAAFKTLRAGRVELAIEVGLGRNRLLPRMADPILRALF